MLDQNSASSRMTTTRIQVSHEACQTARPRTHGSATIHSTISAASGRPRNQLQIRSRVAGSNAISAMNAIQISTISGWDGLRVSGLCSGLRTAASVMSPASPGGAETASVATLFRPAEKPSEALEDLLDHARLGDRELYASSRFAPAYSSRS